MRVKDPEKGTACSVYDSFGSSSSCPSGRQHSTTSGFGRKNRPPRRDVCACGTTKRWSTKGPQEKSSRVRRAIKHVRMIKVIVHHALRYRYCSYKHGQDTKYGNNFYNISCKMLLLRSTHAVDLRQTSHCDISFGLSVVE